MGADHRLFEYFIDKNEVFLFQSYQLIIRVCRADQSVWNTHISYIVILYCTIIPILYTLMYRLNYFIALKYWWWEIVWSETSSLTFPFSPCWERERRTNLCRDGRKFSVFLRTLSPSGPLPQRHSTLFTFLSTMPTIKDEQHPPPQP